jgi:hypothetical protein
MYGSHAEAGVDIIPGFVLPNKILSIPSINTCTGNGIFAARREYKLY